MSTPRNFLSPVNWVIVLRRMVKCPRKMLTLLKNMAKLLTHENGKIIFPPKIIVAANEKEEPKDKNNMEANIYFFLISSFLIDYKLIKKKNFTLAECLTCH